MITRYHANYYARALTQRAIGGDINSLSQSLLNAAVDINPHQIEAALFAFRSPLSKGVILADEVGLGKTIEAGLVLCQYWAIGKRKVIVVCPAALRKQWSFELSEKFDVPNEIIDTKSYNTCLRSGIDPFTQKRVIICSYNFAAHMKDAIHSSCFDLAIIDEAHKLRNVYKKNSVTAHAVRDGLENVKKLLLTATPFQNSLMELYGLTTVIDENIFGDARSFRAEYVNEAQYAQLQMRLTPYYMRTLRKDVVEYINYTKRLPLTQQFDSTELEYELYTRVSEFLRSDNLNAIPARQKMLTTMIIRKILASSTYALLGTLSTIKVRLANMLSKNGNCQITISDILDADELDLALESEEEESAEGQETEAAAPAFNPEAVRREIAVIQGFIDLAKQIQDDSKSKALLIALKNAFAQLAHIGANRKALIFTESTRTQTYLKVFLEQNGYRGKIVTFNGSNADKTSNAILESWLQVHANSGDASGIRAADRRAAIVDYFKNTAEIMIATEAAAEGLNLQFCSLVVNYDLPWNPQRIEQRIGRCHRYGQKSDVVVVNFVNRRNYADLRVFNLLNDKFKLFSDVFGASDEILGQIDGADFEKRIWLIYQECRTEEEIGAAFERLQSELEGEINSRLEDVKEQVLKNFDVDVQERLKLAKEKTSAFLTRHEYMFWELTKYILADYADFDDTDHSFILRKRLADSPCGRYCLISSGATNGIPYRLSHPLAQHVLQTALALEIPGGRIQFSPSETRLNVTLPEGLEGKRGYLLLSSLDVLAFDTEQYSLFTAYTEDGHPLPQELCERMFLCAGREIAASHLAPAKHQKLADSAAQHRQGKLQQIDSRNLSYFEEEEERIYRWERDIINGLERELDTVKRQIREQERLARSATTIEDKIAATKKVEELERSKRRKRIELADREDEVSSKRRILLADLDARMIRQTHFDEVFAIEWQIV